MSGQTHDDEATLAGLLRLMKAQPLAPGFGGELPIVIRSVAAGSTLYHENAAAEAIYFVRAGTFKAYRTDAEGYEQVLWFFGRGDMMALDAVCLGRHPNAVEALEDSSVYALPAQDLFALGCRYPQLQSTMLMAASRQLSHRGEVAEVMAAVAAESRLARFLLQLSQRMAACGQSPRRFRLRMTRRDIASQLGLAHETISRSFTALAASGCMCVSNREVEIIDMGKLQAFARSTRGTPDEADRINGSGALAEAGHAVAARNRRGQVHHLVQ